MIESKDLRVGNFVKCKISNDAGIYKVLYLGHYNAKVSLDEPIIYIDRCSGEHIPISKIGGVKLTSKIIQKCGFHKHNNAWVMDDYIESNYNHWNFTIWDNDNKYNYNSAEFPVSLKYLHQLQNLYYSLTGIELEINL